MRVDPQPFHRARIETLQHALRTAGGVERLASLLEVKPERLRRWMSGEERVPLEIFLDALDLIARGRYDLARPPRSASTVRQPHGVGKALL